MTHATSLTLMAIILLSASGCTTAPLQTRAAASPPENPLTLIDGSCETGRDIGDLASYTVTLKAKPNTLGFIRIRREAIWPADDLSNVLGTVPCGTILHGQGPLKNAEFSAGVGYAVAIRDSEGRQCRGYVSYTVVEVIKN